MERRTGSLETSSMPAAPMLPLRFNVSSAQALRAATVVACVALIASTPARAAWRQHGGTAQHTANTTVPTQPLQAIHWQTPVDLKPQYSGTTLLIHYGSPLVTEANTLIFPVKTGVADTFRVEARDAANGAVKWMLDTDYLLPPHGWVPSVGLVMTPKNRLYVPGGGGTVLWTEDLDTAGPHIATRVAFFGDAAYAANKVAMDASLRICTPLTSAADGTLYFGIRAVSTNPLGIGNGFVKLRPDGQGTFVSALAASGGLANQVATNCAPALSNDEALLYVAMRGNSNSPGYLLALRTADLTTRAMTAPVDPISGQPASISLNGTSSPTVAPDGRVFYGFQGTPFGSNASRGWMMQFDSVLVSTGPPGAFGWDITPSLVPPAAVPGYAGTSEYLLFTKYNFYAAPGGGDGVNKIAVLDPDDSQIDSFSGVTVMKEIRLIACPTPDPAYTPTYPNAVKEWCINTAVVDPATHSVLAGAEDGKLYRWELGSNSFPEVVTLTPGLGEAYTPTMAGPDGQVFAINNATLFAVGATNVGVTPESARGGGLVVTSEPNPFATATTIRFALERDGPARVDVLDLAGRRIATPFAGVARAGTQRVAWNGRDAAGAPVAPGLYVVRFAASGRVTTAKLLRVR
jgi:hypothetical protein